MIPSRFKLVMNYLTRAKKAKPDLPEVFRASQADVPPKKESLETMEAINEFVLRNPRQEKAGGGMLVQPGFGGTRQGYAKVKKKGSYFTDRITDKERLKFLDQVFKFLSIFFASFVC